MPATRRQSQERRRRNNRISMQSSRSSPSLEPARRDRIRCQFRRLPYSFSNEQIRLGEKFDAKCSSIKWYQCSVCQSTFVELCLVEGKCAKCRNREESFPDVFNNPGKIPSQLRDLSYVEKLLIAQSNPTVAIWSLQESDGNNCKANVTYFNRDVEKYATALPVEPADLTSLLILSKEFPDNTDYFRVRSGVVMSALLWLKSHNKYYRNVDILSDVIEKLPADGDIWKCLPNYHANPRGVKKNLTALHESYVPSGNDLLQMEIVFRKLGLTTVNSYKTIYNYKSEGFMARSFVYLFPTGAGDFAEPRAKSSTLNDYVRYLMHFPDQRFAKDPRFRYYAMNALLEHAKLSSTRVQVKRSRFESAAVASVRKAVQEDENNLLHTRVYSTCERGGPKYWMTRRSELQWMAHQIESPSIYFTLTAAHLHWEDVFRLLCPNATLENMTEEERSRLIRDNPVVVARYFKRRCELFVTEVLKPIFRVTDYWYRYEFTEKGVPHLHGLLWIPDAPRINDQDLNESDIDTIRSFYDKLCFAVIPYVHFDGNDDPCERKFSSIPDDDKEDDLIKLLSRVQLHTTHDRSCLRTEKGRSGECRYDFPKNKITESTVVFENEYYRYEPVRNHESIMRYNPIVTSVWRANTDFSAVVSYLSLLMYVTKSPVSSTSFLDSFKELSSDRDENLSSVKNIVDNLMYKALHTERDVSAIEAMFHVMSWPLYKSSRGYVTLYLEDNEWVTVKERNAEEEGSDESSSAIRNYKNRGQDKKNLNLLDYTKKYYKRDGKEKERDKEAICRVFPMLQLTGDHWEDERFYRIQCIVRIPFRTEFDDLLKSNVDCNNWAELYHRYDLGKESGSPVPNEANESENVDSGYGENSTTCRTLQEFLSMESDCPFNALVESRIAAAISSKKDVVEGVDRPGLEKVHEVHKSLKDMKEAIVAYERPLVASFDEISQKILNNYSSQAADIKSGMTKSSVSKKRCVIQGRAGSGKTTLIRELSSRIMSDFGRDALAIMAPTGSAALNVNGETIHSLLEINGQAVGAEELIGEKKLKFEQRFKHVKFILIDEMSMVGVRMLINIQKRCRQMFPKSKEVFGGLCVYMFGDYSQLPPVGDIPLYDAQQHSSWRCATKNCDFSSCANCKKALHIFNSFQYFCELKNCYRQSRSESTEFLGLLDRLANAVLDANRDHEILMSRRKEVLDKQDVESFDDATHLYHRNVDVDGHNMRKLLETGSPIHSISAVDKPATLVDGDKEFGFRENLQLSVGTPVMLRANLCVKAGLVNGKLGTVRSIVYSRESEEAAERPSYIEVEFDSYEGPSFENKCFPVLPITRTTERYGRTYTRSQFPLSVAYAITVHKAQGLTLPKVVVEIGASKAGAGLLYVALSRARKLTDLMISNSFPKSLLQSLNKCIVTKRKNEFINKYFRNNG